MPAEDPALVERFFMEVMDFRPAERAVTDPVHPELLGTWMYCGGSPHDIAFIKGPQRQAAPFRLPPGRLERHPAGRRPAVYTAATARYPPTLDMPGHAL